MIQRVQSIWLLLAAVCAFLTMKFPFYYGIPVTDTLKQRQYLDATTLFYILALTAISGAASLITIFLFKDRKLQIRVTATNLIISIIVLAMYFLSIKRDYTEMHLPLITCLFAFAVPVFLLLALRGIYRDQRLVRSMDRLR